VAQLRLNNKGNEMSVIQEMRDTAAAMEDGPAKKMLIWAELELGERADQIFELEEEVKELFDESEKLREALCAIKAALQVVSGHAHSQAFKLSGDMFTRDFAPFINLMGGHHGDPDYGKKTKPRPHKDAR